GHEVIEAVLQALLEDGRVAQPDDDAADVAAGQAGGEQVRPRLLERGGDGDKVIDVGRAGLEVHLPGGDLLAEVALPLLLDEAVADVREVVPLRVEPGGAALEVRLDVLEQFGDE